MNTRFVFYTILVLACCSCGKDTAVPTGEGNGLKLILQDAYNVGQNSASLSGLLSGGSTAPTVSSRGLCWDTFPHPTINRNWVTAGYGTGTMTYTLLNLRPGKTYYATGFYKISYGTFYGDDISFSTLPATAATVSTTTATSITRSSALVYGSISAAGGGTVSARGICWSATSTTPTLSSGYTSGGSGTGSYSVPISGLAAATTYYVRAYATNEWGTAYGTTLSFKTLN